MPRPLPRALQGVSLRETHHLRYLYYVDSPLTVKSDGSVEEPSGEAKKSFCEEAAKDWGRARKGGEPLIKAAAARMKAQAEALGEQGLQARTIEYKTETRLLAGLGYKNGAEVGLTIHPLYGFPYLPGSSVKGLVRAWAAQQGADAAAMTRIFGSANPSEGHEDMHQQGAVHFYDALPSEWPRLELDVMTPHFGPYYQDPARNPPAVWHDPVPVVFLAVAPNVSFRFLLVAHPGAYGARPSDLDLAAEWLGEALAWFGAGGKTGAGFGRFRTDAFDKLFS